MAHRSSVTFSRAQPPLAIDPGVVPAGTDGPPDYPRAMFARSFTDNQSAVFAGDWPDLRTGDYCYVRSDDERAAAEAAGWGISQQAAADAEERRQQQVANAAAERAASDKKLSAKAQAEKRRQDQATDAHVPE